MNRLTDRSKEIPLPCAYNASSFWARVHEKLARYEDTELEPEKCAKYAQAEKEGRLVVLPCKVGDMVWLIVQGLSSPMPVPVCSLTWRGGEWSINADREETDPPKVVGFQIGKTVFLTREAAEKALKERREE